MIQEESERVCALCEYSHKISGGEYFVCRKKGVVPPDHVCRKFTFDPLKMEVSPVRMPSVPDQFFR